MAVLANLIGSADLTQIKFTFLVCAFIVIYSAIKDSIDNIENQYKRLIVQKGDEVMFPSTAEVNFLKSQYPEGTRIRLNYMCDARAVAPGSEGTVRLVDDAGTIHVNWDNGRSLGIIPDVDSFEIIQ